jgi:hypothetical protein
MESADTTRRVSRRAGTATATALAVVGALIAGLVVGGAIAAGATSRNDAAPVAAASPHHGHEGGGGAVFSGSGAGLVPPTQSGLPSAGWGSLFTNFMEVFAGPQSAVPQPPAQSILPRSGRVGDLHVRNLTPTGQSPALAGPARFTVYDNDQPTSMSCVIPAGSSACTASAAPVRFVSGDLISIQVTALSSQAVFLSVTTWSVTFT